MPYRLSGKSIIRFLTACALLFSFLEVASAQSVVLRPTWQSGKKYTMKIIQEMTMTASDTSDEQVVSMQQKIGMTVSNQSNPLDKHKSVALSFEETRMKINMLGEQSEYDSSDPSKQKNMLADALEKLKDQKVTVIYNGHGVIQEIKGLPANPTAAPGALSEEQIKTMMSDAMVQAIPATAKEPGDSWPYETVIKNGPMDLNVKATVTFTGYEGHAGRNLAKIMFDGKISARMATPQNEVKFDDNSKFIGSILFDVEKKMFIKSDANINVTMQIQGKKMTMKQKILSDLLSIEPSK